MQQGKYRLIWSGLLIVLGLVLLAENFGWLGDWNAPVWSLILGAVSLAFLVTFISDREQWWALIPGLVTLGTAVAVFLAEQDIVEGYVVGSIMLAGVGLPFLVIFITDRRHRWALIPGMTMVGCAVAVLLEGARIISGEAVGGIIFGGVSLGFLSIYWIDRKQWWALFPGGILAAMAAAVLLVTVTEIACPVVIILLGLLMLRGSLGGGRRRRRWAWRASVPPSPPVKPVRPKHQRLPTLEEQIEAAIAEEAQAVEEVEHVEVVETKPELPVDVPPAPEMPEAPEVPAPPEVG